MELSRHVDLGETDGIAEAEAENAWVGLCSCADVKVFHGLIFQTTTQADAFMLCVFLDFTLSNEILGELVGQAETHHDGQLLVVERLLKAEIDGVEDVGAQCQFIGDVRLYAQLKGDGIVFAVVVAYFQQEVVELQADLQIASEVFGVCETELVFVVFR